MYPIVDGVRECNVAYLVVSQGGFIKDAFTLSVPDAESYLVGRFRDNKTSPTNPS